jgi:hypothetical protein
MRGRNKDERKGYGSEAGIGIRGRDRDERKGYR